MRTNNAPTYEDMELLEQCYTKCKILLSSVNKGDIFFQDFKGTPLEFTQTLKKDLQKVIKSLHHKHMENEIKNYKS